MNEKRWWIGILAGGSLLVAGLAALIYWQYGRISRSREHVASLRSELEAARQLLTGTARLERQVIVLRETEQTIKEILPDEQDLNNFVRDLRAFEEDSEVRITGLKKRLDAAARDAQASSFEKVTYGLNLESDAFQFLAFLDRVESHSRFLSVPNFRLVAAPRTEVEEDGIPSHKLQLDVETYVYRPTGGPDSVKIEAYERKRELLLGEITASRQALIAREYDYRGPRGRRDPWVDPRVPVEEGDGTGLTVEEQIQTVEDLVTRTRELWSQWVEYPNAENIIAEMTIRAEVDGGLSELEVEVRRVEEEGGIRFVPSARRLQLEVLDRLTELRTELQSSEGGRGPTEENLREVLAAMVEHINAGEFELALQTFAGVELRLDYVRGDARREIVAQELRDVAEQAKVASEFQKLNIDIGGRAIMEGVPPVVLIGGETLNEGDLVGSDLVIRAIRPDEVEFIYRGVVLIRRL